MGAGRRRSLLPARQPAGLSRQRILRHRLPALWPHRPDHRRGARPGRQPRRDGRRRRVRRPALRLRRACTAASATAAPASAISAIASYDLINFAGVMTALTGARESLRLSAEHRSDDTARPASSSRPPAASCSRSTTIPGASRAPIRCRSPTRSPRRCPRATRSATTCLQGVAADRDRQPLWRRPHAVLVADELGQRQPVRRLSERQLPARLHQQPERQGRIPRRCPVQHPADRALADRMRATTASTIRRRSAPACTSAAAPTAGTPAPISAATATTTARPPAPRSAMSATAWRRRVVHTSGIDGIGRDRFDPKAGRATQLGTRRHCHRVRRRQGRDRRTDPRQRLRDRRYARDDRRQAADGRQQGAAARDERIARTRPCRRPPGLCAVLAAGRRRRPADRLQPRPGRLRPLCAISRRLCADGRLVLFGVGIRHAAEGGRRAGGAADRASRRSKATPASRSPSSPTPPASSAPRGSVPGAGCWRWRPTASRRALPSRSRRVPTASCSSAHCNRSRVED